jgi:hypothetical protein
MAKALSRAATRAALASKRLLRAADRVAAEQDSLDGGSLKVGMEEVQEHQLYFKLLVLYRPSFKMLL